MPQNRMYQVSTLQALALGYSRAVVSAGELLEKGDCGLGTFTGARRASPSPQSRPSTASTPSSWARWATSRH